MEKKINTKDIEMLLKKGILGLMENNEVKSGHF